MIDRLKFHIAIVDGVGCIVLTNEPWRKFAHENGGSDELGSNYLAVCAPEVLAGFKQVMGGELEVWQYEYPCHSPTERRFFRMEVSRLALDEPLFMVSHENITAYQLARFEINSLNAALQAQTEMLAQYTFATTHALQEPLRRLTTTSSALNDLAGEDGRVGRYAQINLKAARQMSSLIDSLGHYAGLVPQHAEQLRRVDFGDCLAQLAHEMGIDLQLLAPLPPVTLGRQHARTLAHNLLDNFQLLRIAGEQLQVSGYSDQDFVHVYLRLQSVEKLQAGEALQLFQPQGRAALGLSQRVASHYGGQMWIEHDGANIGLHLTLPAWQGGVSLTG